MIDFLRGKVAHREPEYVVLDVHGVGYRVFCPNPYAIADEGETTLYIHHHVREDAILLFGFSSREEQSLFRKLLEVSGIGPKVALGILSGGRPEAVIAAVQQENLSFLTRLPGIGKKTAQRIILDLKDKLGGIAAPAIAEDGAALASVPVAGPGRTDAGGGAWAEAREALLALGYSEAEADRALQSARTAANGNEPAETLVKLALRSLFAG
jgi:Holliday junction DNA helicase RuvA